MSKLFRAPRAIVDGNLSRTRTVEDNEWYGFKINPGWTHTDPAGHTHTADEFYRSTYQPREEIYCVDHNEVEERSVGERRCRQCDAEITPAGMWGHWHDARPGPSIWIVEFFEAESRRQWEFSDDDLGARIVEAGAIAPFVEELGNPTEWESWS